MSRITGWIDVVGSVVCGGLALLFHIEGSAFGAGAFLWASGYSLAWGLGSLVIAAREES